MKYLITAIVILFAGCSQQAQQPDVPSRPQNFGLMPLSEPEKDRMYHEEPTLFQQEPDLAK